MSDTKDKVKAAAAAAAVVGLHQQESTLNVRPIDQASEVHASQLERQPLLSPRASDQEQHPPKKK